MTRGMNKYIRRGKWFSSLGERNEAGECDPVSNLLGHAPNQTAALGTIAHNLQRNVGKRVGGPGKRLNKYVGAFTSCQFAAGKKRNTVGRAFGCARNL